MIIKLQDFPNKNLLTFWHATILLVTHFINLSSCWQTHPKLMMPCHYHMTSGTNPNVNFRLCRICLTTNNFNKRSLQRALSSSKWPCKMYLIICFDLIVTCADNQRKMATSLWVFMIFSGDGISSFGMKWLTDIWSSEAKVGVSWWLHDVPTATSLTPLRSHAVICPVA